MINDPTEVLSLERKNAIVTKIYEMPPYSSILKQNRKGFFIIQFRSDSAKKSGRKRAKAIKIKEMGYLRTDAISI
jgi:hypothetical protein